MISLGLGVELVFVYFLKAVFAQNQPYHPCSFKFVIISDEISIDYHKLQI